MNARTLHTSAFLVTIYCFTIAPAFGQKTKTPTLDQTLNWLVTKLIAYSEDGNNLQNIMYKPSDGTDATGDPITIFKKNTAYTKPDFNYNLQSGTIIMGETSNKEFFKYNISLSKFNTLSLDEKSYVRRNATWISNPRRSTRYFLSFQFLDRAEFDLSTKVLTIYTSGNFVRIDNGERDNSITVYFNIDAEPNLLQRINNAINNIKVLTKAGETF